LYIEELTTEPYNNGSLRIPTGPRLGIDIAGEQLARYSGDRVTFRGNRP
jgi:hypothetical protein